MAEMKVSELIKGLQAMMDEHGDLRVSIHQHVPGLSQIVGPDVAEIVYSDDLYLGYDGYEDHGEIDIRNFPY